MLVLFTCVVVGFILGLTYKQERLIHQYYKTRDEIEQEVLKELAYYKNLSESLKQDLHDLKTRKSNLGN
jgi:Na+-translocating ferredoxin:NAD+ oxidoreductase RnfG subunit